MQKNWLSLFTLAFALISTYRSASADQCAWTTKAAAQKAAALVKESKFVINYCELCSGDKPQKEEVTSVKVQQVVFSGEIQKGYWELLINNKAVDLAYVFVESQTEKEYLNLGVKSECGASGVSRTITYPQKLAKDKYKLWYGTYRAEDRSVKIVLKPQKLHGPNWLKIRIYMISEEMGDSRGEFFGYLQMDTEKPTYVTPLYKCHLYFSLHDHAGAIGKRKTLEVKDNEKCGALVLALTGKYIQAKQ